MWFKNLCAWIYLHPEIVVPACFTFSLGWILAALLSRIDLRRVNARLSSVTEVHEALQTDYNALLRQQDGTPRTATPAPTTQPKTKRSRKKVSSPPWQEHLLDDAFDQEAETKQENSK